MELEGRLRAHSGHFASMVELIPAKYYITKDDNESGDSQDSKYWVNKRKKKTPKEIVKKAKRMKLDPQSQRSVAELEADAANREEKRLQRGTLNGVEGIQSLRLSELQERLKEKLEGFRKNRKVQPDREEGGTSEKVAAKRQKKMEKRKREKELRKKTLVHGSGQNVKDSGRAEGATALTGGDKEGERVVFSKLDFSNPVEKEVHVESKKKKGGKKDYKRLLAKAEASQKKLEELKKNDERRGRELERKLQWQKALDMARGTKVKDDPKLLKKSSKRVEKRKEKSKKAWEERRGFEKEAKEKRQEKRTKNLQQRRDQVKEKKIKKRVKKGSKRTPGF